MPAVAMDSERLDDRCIRCGYDLRGVDDFSPCPECGLLAERSRNNVEHLSEASPRWLRGLAVGSALLLVAHILALLWHPIWDTHREHFVGRVVLTMAGTRPTFRFFPSWYARELGNPLHAYVIGFEICAVLLFIGVWMVSRPAKRQSPDLDRPLRTALRLSVVPVFASLAFAHYAVWHSGGLGPWTSGWRDQIVILLITAGSAALPVLLFIHLRRLARRVLNPRLAEHATIVAVGYAGTLVLMPVVIILYHLGVRRGGDYWATRSELAMGLFIAPIIAVLFFGGWTALNCGRFVFAFTRAWRAAQRKWADADRSRDATADDPSPPGPAILPP